MSRQVAVKIETAWDHGDLCDPSCEWCECKGGQKTPAYCYLFGVSINGCRPAECIEAERAMLIPSQGGRERAMLIPSQGGREA